MAKSEKKIARLPLSHSVPEQLSMNIHTNLVIRESRAPDQVRWDLRGGVRGRASRRWSDRAGTALLRLFGWRGAR